MTDFHEPSAIVWQQARQECSGSSWKRWAFHGFNVADKAITHRVTTRGEAVEANPVWKPVFGKRVSALEAGAMSALSSLGYEVAFQSLRHDCRQLAWFQGASLVVQGGVVAANLRFVF